jgi:hypothetical protein
VTGEQDGDEIGVLIDATSSSPLTVVAFGGLTEQGVAPVFEFFRFLSGFDVRRVFVRDHFQAWYQLGVRDAGDSIDAVQAHLLDVLGEETLPRAIFTGGSAGGYAAMFFGARLGVGEVHAFAPQTFLTRRHRRYYRDFRWQKQVNNMWAQAGSRTTYYDLRPAVRRANRRHPVPLHVHLGRYELDMHHARRMRRTPGVTLHVYDDIADHRVARTLNADGRLGRIFEEALERIATRSKLHQ